MNGAERKELKARFEEMKKKKGLKDMKFYFGNVSESTVEGLCSDANAFYRALEKNDYTTVESFGDSHKNQA